MLRSLSLCLIFAISVLPRSALSQDGPLHVFAAASLGDALRTILKSHPSPTRLSVAGSGTIARQVDQGAPADVVILASPDWMAWLEQRQAIIPHSRRSPIGNALALVGPPGAPPLTALTSETLLARLGPDGRFAMGHHKAVPAGQYGKIWLENSGLWKDLAPRLAETDNVRAALALVSRGEVPIALVYASDLVAAPGAATKIWDIADQSQPTIAYAFAAVTAGGVQLLDTLTSDPAINHFAAFGFRIRPVP
ncbi:MAG: molybdate ABC transporter substrate-binding protein [Paracoccaceae bacterium]